MVTESRFSWDRTDDFHSPAERLRVDDLDDWDLNSHHPDRTTESVNKKRKRRRRTEPPHDHPHGPKVAHPNNKPANFPDKDRISE